MALVEIDGAAIDDQRPSRVIGNETVVLEAGGKGFSRLDEFRSLSFAGASDASGALSVFLHIFKNRHRHSPLSLD